MMLNIVSKESMKICLSHIQPSCRLVNQVSVSEQIQESLTNLVKKEKKSQSNADKNLLIILNLDQVKLDSTRIKRTVGTWK